MATMEHRCNSCQNVWFDNERYGECPECKSTDVHHHSDEAGDSFDEEEPETLEGWE